MVSSVEIESAADEIDRMTTDVGSFFEAHFPERVIDRVLLVNPPDADASLFNFDIARLGTLSNFPPYGLAVLAQHLRTMDIQVRIVNLNFEILEKCHQAVSKADFDFAAAWETRLDKEINEFCPNLIGVTCMFTMTHNSFKQVCERAALSGTPIVIGGVHVTNDVERILDDVPSVKAAFLREGDESTKQFVRAIRREIEPSDLAQVIIAHNGERHRFSTEMQPTETAIDIIPAFDLIDVSDLSRYGVIGSFHFFKPKGTRFATSLSNRGCRAQCTFCSVRNFNGVGVRQRSIESLLDELELLENEYGINHIMWLDDDLFKDHKRAISLFNGMVKRGLKMTWDASNGVIASSCTDEVISAAVSSGCLALIIGMESGNAKILREVRKPGTVEVFLRAAEVLGRYEQINTSAYLIIGFPGETMSMIMDTINVSLEMNLDWYRIKTLQPLSNTPIYDTMLADGLLHDIENREVRYMTGAYGRARQTDLLSADNVKDGGDVLSAIPMDSIPTSEQLDEIWFHMNYKLNYERVFNEQRPVKLSQQFQFVQSICDVIGPGNAIAHYTKGVLQSKLLGTVDEGLINSLESRLNSSPYWSERFKSLGLSPGDLRQ